MKLAAPVLLWVLLVLIVLLLEGGVAWVANPARPSFVTLALVWSGLALVSFVMAILVNVNRFSLHAMYRERLIRAYLGASRPSDGINRRNPNPFTGFDPADNLDMAAVCQRPFHIVNIALNLVKGSRLAWQHRKAESFTVTPLHCGSCVINDDAPAAAAGESAKIRGAYQPTSLYGGSEGGITLGTAMAISGAAASPNMGYHSSPIVTFLMTLLNARLGWWLANPGRAGRRAHDRAGPRLALRPILSEAFGLTNDESPYVYLSDGGHFDNLGLYEMVLRRCHCIFLVDAGCDPRYELTDLGNAVRKIRIDLGIEIELCEHGPCAVGRFPHYVLGRIRYATMDGIGAPDGLLVYVKPSLTGDEPVDVRNYAAAHPGFPHETTADQWFDEDQLEAYRMLGLITVQRFATDRTAT